ncbi:MULTISPECIES: common pilus major fimbrillin subunit EcpA [Proteus]|uniref:common pilus major fimbrillin subunit EcpA n=1 Tax=Proteus TaxID=583 RepID=UPI00288B5524|nr:common pilus major fimbrillin subunit EcpA [Proteus terrae]
MKKLTLAVLAVAIMGATTLAQADTRKANAVASWDAKAIKDTKSMLVVTPLKSLVFNYAEGVKGFNTQDGAFDITIQGQEKATDFKLTSKVISNELRNSADNSVLTVKTDWNGKTLSSHQETVILDNQKGINKGLVVETKATEKSELKNLQSAFLFNVINRTEPTTTLPEGLWEGTLRIEFTSKWSGDFVTLATR